ncbi:MAG: lipid-A-disaccharide synthase [Phycisphaeraceae bacterium]|nr:lipid-A-disaccharide synthase [Phycisphaeraceae bacterium]
MTVSPHVAETPPATGVPRADGERPRAVLFTAFEPSGDDHAAAAIAALRQMAPDVKIYAWGGPKMAAAGAEVVEQTGHDAVMGLPGLKKIREHRRINARIARWLRANPVDVHVPVDSPAANFPICQIARQVAGDRGLRIVHLVAPQIWAWGQWRIHKLRRLTNLVLCLLPFEEAWFKERGVPARFIGHPLFDLAHAPTRAALEASDLADGPVRVALMPGSRPAEIAKNFPLMLPVFRSLTEDRPGLVGTVAATTPAVAERLKQIAADHGGWPENLQMVSGRTDAVIGWCTLALVVSGTVTLQIARQERPMVVFYKSNPLPYMLLGRWILRTEFFTLPNLIAAREIVPELVPHFAGPEPILAAARELLASPEAVARQVEELRKVVRQFGGHRAGQEAAAAICEVLEGAPAGVPVGGT